MTLKILDKNFVFFLSIKYSKKTSFQSCLYVLDYINTNVLNSEVFRIKC